VKKVFENGLDCVDRMQTQVRRKTIFLIMTCMYAHMYEHMCVHMYAHMYVHMYAHMYHNPEYISLDLHYAH
jgi:hypothetical protein